MSGVNGDKARFHRQRKQKIARRIRTRELLQGAVAPPKPGDKPGPGKPKQVSA